ncbi:uncharacterized protein LOC144159548 [Haemaphysalis longicornis]
MCSFGKLVCHSRNMEQTMQGLLLVSFVNYFSSASATLLGSLQQAAQLPGTDSDFGNIRLGKPCETSSECRSHCCLFNRTAGTFTCQSLNQRYSNCSPWRPKILKGTLLDVYLRYCPCKHHLRCVKEHTWHVCLKKKLPPVPPNKPELPGKPPLGKPPASRPGKPPVKPLAKPPVKPPVEPPVWTNGTLDLGDPCVTSIDCKSECCVFNPRIGFAFCHKLQQIYDDCSPWHHGDEKGTLVDVYFRHCPCRSHLRCTKQQKWHICRKEHPMFGIDKTSQQQPLQQQEIQKPQLGAQEQTQPQVVGVPEQVIQKPHLETQQPSQQVVEETAVGQAEVHEPKPENNTQQIQQKPTGKPPKETPPSDGQKPLPPPPLQKPVTRKPKKPAGNAANIPQQQVLQQPPQQTVSGGHQTLDVDDDK